VIVDVIELKFDSDGVPGVVEHEETLPVDPKGWSDDENTESLTVKEVAATTDQDKPDRTEPLPKDDDDTAMRPTQPMQAVSIPADALGGPGKRDRARIARAATDPPPEVKDAEKAEEEARGSEKTVELPTKSDAETTLEEDVPTPPAQGDAKPEK
jgi:hypothetical protein